jgi:hypothetical protein
MARCGAPVSLPFSEIDRMRASGVGGRGVQARTSTSFQNPIQ